MYRIEERKGKFYVVNSENCYEEFEFSLREEAEKVEEKLNFQKKEIERQIDKKLALHYELGRTNNIFKSIRDKVKFFLERL